MKKNRFWQNTRILHLRCWLWLTFVSFRTHDDRSVFRYSCICSRIFPYNICKDMFFLQLYPRKPQSQTIQYQNVTFSSVLHEQFFSSFFIPFRFCELKVCHFSYFLFSLFPIAFLLLTFIYTGIPIKLQFWIAQNKA